MTQTTLDGFSFKPKGAILSDDGVYRYRLHRVVNPQGAGTVLFIMLNPSTADDDLDDPTIRRCIGFAYDLGYRRLEVVNLFAYRSPKPVTLRHVDDPTGPENDYHLKSAAGNASLIIAAWGANVAGIERGKEVMAMLDDLPVYCLEITQLGSPKHPLYIKAGTQPIPYGGIP